MKDVQIHLSLWKCRLELQFRNYNTLIRKAKIKNKTQKADQKKKKKNPNLKMPSVGRDMEN